MATRTLSKVNVRINKNYKKDGLKSYVYLLNKWGFEPTVEGPYHHVEVKGEVKGAKGLLAKLTGKSHSYKELRKRHPKHGAGSGSGSTTAPTTGSGTGTAPTSGPGSGAETGEITADDQQNDSLYLCEVDIGTPAQKLMLDFDTGSSDLWVWSTKLPASITSGGSGHTIFDPTKSSTFKTVSGASWKIAYGDSSTASGTVGTDNITIGGLTVTNQAIELASDLSAQFQQGTGDGLLGLAWGSINTVSPTQVQTPVQNMITQDDISKSAELFTAYLGSWRDNAADAAAESFYTFGYIDQKTVVASGQDIYYTPVDNSQGFWMFDSTSASVNGKIITRSGNTAIADTGTTLALVDDKTCAAIYAAIPGAKQDSSAQGWVFPSTTDVNSLPVVEFAVGGKLFAVQKEDIAFADAGNGMVYGGIQSRGTMTFDILGDTFLKGIYAIFDQGNVRFGAVPREGSTQGPLLPPAGTTA